MGTASINAPLWGARARDWADVQEGTLQSAFERVIDTLGVDPGVRFVDLACGAGMAAAIAADRGATVSGLDAAAPLLAIARERVPGGDFREGDLEALPFADDAFDVATAFNAVQYASDPVAALTEAARVVRPGGRIAVVVWAEPDTMGMASILTSLAPLLPPPPPGAAGPFALSGEPALRAIAERARLSVDAVETIDLAITYPDRATALRGLRSSGVAARAISIVGETAVDAAHEAALARFGVEDGGYRVDGRVRCLFARVRATTA